MLEAVVVGVVGVLLPREALWRARIAAVATCLERHGIPRAAFERAALLEMRSGREHSPVSRALARLDRRLAAALERQLVLTWTRTMPATPPRAADSLALRCLGERHRVALLDDGDATGLETWIESQGLAGVIRERLWIDRLGQQARPPSRLAFHWLERRLGLRPQECLYLAAGPQLLRAAQSAGWRVERFDAGAGGLPAWVERLESDEAHPRGGSA
jgi:FMN phosphatase YigB (HAD superfamily)